MLAAYRVLIQGWETDRAVAEMADYDWSPKKDRVVLEYLNNHVYELSSRLVELQILGQRPAELPRFY